jgi:hypothetical protein
MTLVFTDAGRRPPVLVRIGIAVVTDTGRSTYG